MSVAVVGAGVVGLTTASHLQAAFPEIKLTIIADKFDVETTSDGAAGLFLPSSNYMGTTPFCAKDWISYSYKYYENLLNEDCGIFETTGFLLSSQRIEDVSNELMEGIAPQYRPATTAELSTFPGNYKYGTFIRTLIIRCRTFLPWLLERIKLKGGVVERRKVKDFSELAGQYDVVVNCTGLQSRWLCDDKFVIPVRGQIVKVRASIDQFFLVNGPETYIIPHEKDSIVSLGGTCQFNVWDDHLSDHDSKGIRSRCASVLPGLANAEVAWEWVGLRPYRYSVRVEAEAQNGLKIVHNYGHGGYGVTAAPGTARDTTNLVRKLLTSLSKT